VNRQGIKQSIPAPARTYRGIRISPDGERLTAEVQDLSRSVSQDLWIYELQRQTFNKVTFEGLNRFPVWSTDGKRLIHASNVTTRVTGLLRSSPADSSGQPVDLLKDDSGFIPSSSSQDGFLIGVRPATPGGTAPGNQLAVLKLDSNGASVLGKLEPFLDARFRRSNPDFSPDGKWVAFQSNQTGADEIYVVPYPGPGGIVQVSAGGGTQPRWNRNGRELFFRNSDQMMAANIEISGSTLRADTPHELFSHTSAFYDVSPDGQRFLMLDTIDAPSGPAETSREWHVIVNWFDELRRLVPLPE
jgi:hypothetical protein